MYLLLLFFKINWNTLQQQKDEGEEEEEEEEGRKGGGGNNTGVQRGTMGSL